MFLATLGEVCQRNGWRVHAYVLMSNHYHLLVETPKGNLVSGMHWFQATYTMRYNRRHRLSGHLFAGRYKSLLIDPEERGYLATVSDYIHLNPARAYLTGEKPLGNYRWSSLRWYGSQARNRPEWLEVNTVLGELGWSDRAPDRRAYLKRLEERAREKPPGRSLGPVPGRIATRLDNGRRAISRSGAGVDRSIERSWDTQVGPGGNLGRSRSMECRALSPCWIGAVQAREGGSSQTAKERLAQTPDWSLD